MDSPTRLSSDRRPLLLPVQSVTVARAPRRDRDDWCGDLLLDQSPDSSSSVTDTSPPPSAFALALADAIGESLVAGPHPGTTLGQRSIATIIDAALIEQRARVAQTVLDSLASL